MFAQFGLVEVLATSMVLASIALFARAVRRGMEDARGTVFGAVNSFLLGMALLLGEVGGEGSIIAFTQVVLCLTAVWFLVLEFRADARASRR